MIFRPEEITCDNYWHREIFSNRNAEFIGYMRVRDQFLWHYWCIETHQYGEMAAILGFYGHPDNSTIQYKILPGYMAPHFTFYSEEFDRNVRRGKYPGRHIHLHLPVPTDEYLQRNQYVLYFVGCDDGSKGLRFKTKSEAMLFLDHYDYFDDFIHICEEHN